MDERDKVADRLRELLFNAAQQTSPRDRKQLQQTLKTLREEVSAGAWYS